MKQSKKAQLSITKPLLEGLGTGTAKSSKSQRETPEIVKPSLGKTIEKQPDLAHDSGGGYNSDLSFPQN